MRYPVSIIFIILLFPVILFSQDRGDYPVRPEMLFQFHHLALELEVDSEENKIRGIAEYEVSPRQDNLQDVLLFADNISIDRIRVNNDEVEFQQQSDSLWVQLANPFYAGEQFKVEITYEAEPQFGVHFNNKGTTWTSMLPKSNRHWLPGFDHPRTELTTSIHIRIPDDQEAIASGNYLGEETVEEGFKQVGYKSDNKLPLSDIGFVTGYLEVMETMVGTKPVHLYSEQGLLDAERSSILLGNTYNRIQETERYLSYEYPYDSFHLIALEDDRWETRSYAAGMGFIFSNRGEFVPQVANNVYAQWFGMHQRPEQWGDAGATLLHQAWLADFFGQSGLDDFNENVDRDETSTVYKNFSPEQLNKLISYVQQEEGSALVNLVESYARKVLTSEGSVMGWSDYARFWYEQTGENWFQKPTFPDGGNEVGLSYNIDVVPENLSENLAIHITPEYAGTDETYNLPVYLFENEEAAIEEHTFSGQGDTLIINDGANLDNVALAPIPGLTFTINKPFSYWLHQLRRDSDSERRKQAALAIEGFSDQPDLQLALNGVLAREEDPEVKAAVLKAMAEVTGGASGVQNWFLSRLDDEHESIQREALRALRYYPDDDIVERDVFEIISMSDNIDLVNEAISVYRSLVPEADFLEFADQFLNEDEDRQFSYALINELYKTSEIEFANERTDDYLAVENPFKVRYTAFQQLNWNDYDADRWAERVETYFTDPDPRIRYLMLSRIDTLSHEDRDRLLIEQETKEKDVRVLAY